MPGGTGSSFDIFRASVLFTAGFTNLGETSREVKGCLDDVETQHIMIYGV